MYFKNGIHTDSHETYPNWTKTEINNEYLEFENATFHTKIIEWFMLTKPKKDALR